MVHIFFCVSQDGPNLQQGFFQKLAFSNIFDGGFPDICNYHLEHELIFRPFDGFFERKWISGSIRIQQFIYMQQPAWLPTQRLGGYWGKYAWIAVVHICLPSVLLVLPMYNEECIYIYIIHIPVSMYIYIYIFLMSYIYKVHYIDYMLTNNVSYNISLHFLQQEGSCVGCVGVMDGQCLRDDLWYACGIIPVACCVYNQTCCHYCNSKGRLVHMGVS